MNTLVQRSLIYLITAFLAVGTPLLTGCQADATIDAGVSQQQGAHADIQIHIKKDPPGTELANADTSQAILNLSVSNATLSSSTGNATLSVQDNTTGQIVGSTPFTYVVVGNSFYAQDPASLHNFLQQFAGYSDVDAIIDLTPGFDTTTDGTSSVVASAVYQGTAYATATVSWDYSSDDPCAGRPHCNVVP